MRITGLAKIVSIAAVLLVLLVQAAIAQTPSRKTDSSVKVTDIHGKLTVQITQAAHVREILDAICESTNIKCDIAPGLGEADLVAPMTASGEWSQVIPQLLEGSRLNYSFAAPTPRQSGQLFVQARAAFEEPRQNPATPPNSMDVATPPMSMISPTSVLNNSPSEAADVNHEGASGSDSEAATQVETPAGTVMTPFPVTGVPSSHFMPSGQASNITPFSDAAGNPIQVQVTNEPPSVLPFSDSQGRPLPAPAIIPGQKLEYPIPPTPR